MNRDVAHETQASEDRTPASNRGALLVCTLLLGLTGLAPRPGHALDVGTSVYVTDEETRLRAGPATGTDVLASLERGRWLQVQEVGPAAQIGGLEAPWIRVSDPWAPETDAPFLAPTSGWVWGGLLRPIPAELTQPSVANWERVVVRVDPHTRALDLDSADGQAVAWAVHFDPDREGSPRTLEVAEWMRLGAAPTRSWTLVGWRRLASLSVVPLPEGLTWLRIEGEGNRRQRRTLLRPSLLDAQALDLDWSGAGARSTELLFTDLDGDGGDELVLLETSFDDQGQPLERGLSRFALTAEGPAPLEDPVVRNALMPAPNLIVESVSTVRAGATVVLTVRVRSEAAGAAASTLVVRSWGERRESEATRGPLQRTTAPVPALVPGQIVEVPLSIEVERGWPLVGIEATIVPVAVESRLDDNRWRATVEPD